MPIVQYECHFIRYALGPWRAAALGAAVGVRAPPAAHGARACGGGIYVFTGASAVPGGGSRVANILSVVAPRNRCEISD